MKHFFSLLFALFFLIVSAQKNDKDDYAKFNEFYFKGLQEWIKDNPEQAIKYFNRCLELNDTVAAVHYYLAAAYQKTGNPGQAVYHIERALATNPQNKWFRRLKNQLQSSPVEKKEKPPVTRSENAIKSESDVLRDIKQKKFNLSAGEYYNYLVKSAEKFPFYARVQYETARAALALNKPDEAENYLINGMDFALTDKNLLKKYYQLLIEIYQRKNEKEKVRKYQNLLKTLK